MKKLILCLFLISSAYAGTCTSISRSNYTPNSVLTSSALNADFNQLVSGHNSFDGGCVNDGTLEKSALNSTDFAVVFNSIKNGCILTKTASDTATVDKCQLSVSGNLVSTDIATNVTFGCTDCSPEAANTEYYVYAKNGSSGSTLNLYLSTTAPNSNEYDDNGNRAIGKVKNNSSSDLGNVVWNYKQGTLVSNEVTYSALVTYSAGPTYTISQNVQWLDSVTATAPGGVNKYLLTYTSGSFASGAGKVCTVNVATQNSTSAGISTNNSTSDYLEIFTIDSSFSWSGSHSHISEAGMDPPIPTSSTSISVSGGSASVAYNTSSFLIMCHGVK